MKSGPAQKRWTAIRKIIDQSFPKVAEPRRTIAAANIRYFLSASAWHYHRYIFRFTLEESIECAETAIRQTLEALRK